MESLSPRTSGPLEEIGEDGGGREKSDVENSRASGKRPSCVSERERKSVREVERVNVLSSVRLSAAEVYRGNAANVRFLSARSTFSIRSVRRNERSGCRKGNASRGVIYERQIYRRRFVYASGRFSRVARTSRRVVGAEPRPYVNELE